MKSFSRCVFAKVVLSDSGQPSVISQTCIKVTSIVVSNNTFQLTATTKWKRRQACQNWLPKGEKKGIKNADLKAQNGISFT